MDFDYINKNSLKILGVLREGRLYFNQIHERSKISSRNGLLNLLRKLEKNGIILMEKNKSNTFYEINFSNPLAISLLLIIDKMNFSELPFAVRKSVQEIILKTKPKMAVLFGSYAKGNAVEKSDVDLVFVGVKNKNSLAKEGNEKYGVELNVTFMKEGEFDCSNEQIAHVLKTGYPVVGGEYFYEEYKKV